MGPTTERLVSINSSPKGRIVVEGPVPVGTQLFLAITVHYSSFVRTRRTEQGAKMATW